MRLKTIAGNASYWSLVSGILLLASPASAQLTFNFPGNAPANVKAAFGEAGDLWAQILEDNVTINVTVNWANLGGGVLGSTSNVTFSSSYSSVRTAMTNDQLSPDDATAVANLPAGNSMPVWINRTSDNPNGSGSATPYLDNDGGTNNNTIQMSRSNAKVLGLVPGNSGNNDGTITFNSTFGWDFDRSNGITGGQYDIVGIAAHEIGHLLGFYSGVDFLDIQPGQSENAYRLSTPDMFRYSANSVAQDAVDFTANNVDKFFSIDGGATFLGQFAEGQQFGDSRQASHWKDNLGIGIMDPTAGAGEFLTITEMDTRLMDVTGWNRNFNKYWINPASSTFATKRSWNGDVPTSAHTAIFDIPNTYTTSFASTSRTNDRVLVNDGNVTFSFTGVTTYNLLAATAGTPSVVVAEGSGDTSSLTISGGTVAGVYGTIGRNAGANGAVTVNGATSNFNFSNSLGVGGTSAAAGGTGALNITGGAFVRATNLLKVWSGGTVTMAGSTIDAGTVELTGGRLSGTGTVDAALTNAGELAPGASAGLLNVVGSYSQTGAGTLEIEVGGNTAGTQYDRLAVTGIATLGGTLDLSVINAFVPTPGSLFDVITFASRVGEFSTVNGDVFGVDAGQFFVPVYTATDVTLYVPLVGDANFDGQVTGADYTIWGDGFGQFAGDATWADGDFNGDGFVTGADYTLWGDNFGDSVDFNMASMAVPEPSTIALGALALVGMLAIRRRK